MPIKQKAFCTEPGCREIATNGTKCEKHFVPPIRKQSSRYHHWYGLPVWKALRKRWLNAQPLCEECKRQGHITPAEVVDHIKPHEGKWERFMDTDNLQSLCVSCHNKKTAMEDGGFGNRRK